jgi:hypothetical protein
VEAFAGVTFWRTPELHWRHDIDWRSPGGEDRGTVEWNARGFRERGETRVEGRIVQYEEQWEQVVAGHDCFVARAEDHTAALVAVGRYAIALADWRPENDDFAIRIMRATKEGWHNTWRRGGTSSSLPSPNEFTGRIPDDEPIVVDGRRWHVVESMSDANQPLHVRQRLRDLSSPLHDHQPRTLRSRQSHGPPDRPTT